MASAKWLEARTRELLPVPYFHLVFTIPHELNGIFLQNRKILFDILFRSVTKTLHDLAAKRLGGSLGFFSVLHSWGKKMEFHPHLHTVVPGVILKTNGSIEVAPKNYLLPKNVLSPVFRAVFIKALVRAYKAGKLSFFGNQEFLKEATAFFDLIKQVKEKHWICYAKKPFSGPKVVLKYLACYTHRVAISEKRILEVKDDCVTFSYKDYADGSNIKTLCITVAEFARRFLLHVLPKEFVRIRYSGFLSVGKRTKSLAKLKSHFNFNSTHSISSTAPKAKTCPHCGSLNLHHSAELLPVRHSSYSHKTKALPLVA
jgi:hypothetical protein